MTRPTSPTPTSGFADDAQVPRGFRFAGIRCGIKQARPDLALVVSDTPAAAAGCYTRNPVRAACVGRNAALLPAAGVHAIVVNSGNANAMTGAAGERANAQMAEELAKVLACSPEGVLTASTGIIGVPLPVDIVVDALDSLLGAAGYDPRSFSEAILTTDTVTKIAHVRVVLPGDSEPVHVLGVAKGSGMIHPNMATTLSFVCTDAAVAPALLQRMLSSVIDDTFNAISVDGDTSTNDMALVLANGASGVHVEGDAREAAFTAALRAVLLELAKQVARDGEGATRLLEVVVTGAPDVVTARAIARGVCRGSLVKCSIFAGQAQWGRIAAAVGQSSLELGVAIDPKKLVIGAQGMVLYDGDGPRGDVKAAEIKRKLRTPDVQWTVELGLGQASATAFGCDLSYDYVRINADEIQHIEVGRTGRIARNITLAAYSPRLKHQLLVEGLAYVRRFTGLRVMIYLAPAAARRPDAAASLANDVELCLDAGLKPLAVVPDNECAKVLQEHMARTGHYAASVPPDPLQITTFLDRGHLCVLVREAPAPDAIVELALKLGIQKLIVLGNEQGLRDAHGFVQRLSPETLLAGLERGRFDESDPDLLVLARHAATRGVPALHIIDARMPHAVVGELFTDQGVGTLVTRQALA
jgi:acetylglutamate kinase